MPNREPRQLMLADNSKLEWKSNTKQNETSLARLNESCTCYLGGWTRAVFAWSSELVGAPSSLSFVISIAVPSSTTALALCSCLLLTCMFSWSWWSITLPVVSLVSTPPTVFYWQLYSCLYVLVVLMVHHITCRVIDFQTSNSIALAVFLLPACPRGPDGPYSLPVVSLVSTPPSVFHWQFYSYLSVLIVFKVQHITCQLTGREPPSYVLTLPV